MFSERKSQGEMWAEDFVADYQAGDTVTAYYDPDHPSQAYLVKNRTLMPLIVLGVGVFTVLGGVLGLLQRLYDFGKSSPPGQPHE